MHPSHRGHMHGATNHFDKYLTSALVRRMQQLLTYRQGLMKGYISREHAMVVLNKKGAFPGTGV